MRLRRQTKYPILSLCMMVNLAVLKTSVLAFSGLHYPRHSPIEKKKPRYSIFRSLTNRQPHGMTGHCHFDFQTTKVRLFGRRKRGVALPSSRIDEEMGREDENDNGTEDLPFSVKGTIFVVGGQSLLIVASVIVAAFLDLPKYGMGSNFVLTSVSVTKGALATLPLFVLAAFLEVLEPRFKALKDVTIATQRSVLSLLGGTWRPIMAIVAAVALGLVAGIGEEMLFRGILQNELGQRFGPIVAVSATSVIFGALHAVTPIYAFLASLASVFFGYLYISSDFNLAVPITSHALYDFVALIWAHWCATHLTKKEQMDILTGGN